RRILGAADTLTGAPNPARVNYEPSDLREPDRCLGSWVREKGPAFCWRGQARVTLRSAREESSVPRIFPTRAVELVPVVRLRCQRRRGEALRLSWLSCRAMLLSSSVARISLNRSITAGSALVLASAFWVRLVRSLPCI